MYPLRFAPEIIPAKPIITTRTRTFADLEKLAIEGINYHWGRNKKHAVANDVKIGDDTYEVYINALNTEKESIDDIELVYNTNGDWKRSGNPGTVEDPISFVGNIVSREAICYNVGHIKFTQWRYILEADEDIEFSFTSAHEIGHTILKTYGGTFYSYGHKGSVNTITQKMKDSAPAYPISGEIDIMPYYPSSPLINLYNRYVAAQKDVLSLLWLTKIKTN